MPRIGKFAIAFSFLALAAPVFAGDGRFDLVCHGTRTIFLEHGKRQDTTDTTLSVDLGARRICEHPCTDSHRITALSASELTVNGLKPRIAALDEIQAYTRGAISFDGAAYDEANSVLRLQRDNGHLTWITPLRLRDRTDQIVVEADCTQAPFSRRR